MEGVRPFPAQGLLRERHFLGPERAAVGGARARLVRRAVADRRAHGDDRGTFLLADGGLDRPVDPVDVGVAVLDAEGLPAVGRVAREHVLGEALLRGPVERDVVVVVEVDELSELQMPGQRARLRGDPLHEIPVSHQAERPVIDERVTRTVVAVGEPALRHRHADGVGRALAEGARRGLDARRQVEFGVAGGPAAPLAERLQVVEGEVVARQVQQAVEQRAAVARRKHETVPVGPVGRARVVAQVALPEDVRHRRGAERKSRVTRVRFLDHVDRQSPDRVDREFVERLLSSRQSSLLRPILLRARMKRPRSRRGSARRGATLRSRAAV